MKSRGLNIPPRMWQYINREPPLHLTPFHPLHILSQRIKNALPGYKTHDNLKSTVSTYQNFDSLNIPASHSSRSLSDTYYVDEHRVLRTHTSAHQVELLKNGERKFIVVGPVFRRDEVDRFHSPAFHQLEAVHVFHPLELNTTESIFQSISKEVHTKKNVTLTIVDEVEVRD